MNNANQAGHSADLLTPAQQRALSRDRHLSVTANAGSGKTRVLVERYIQLVRSGAATARDIVALTYTEKAASELRRRVAEAVAASLADCADPVVARRLENLRNDLAAAMIGTIHAFCARVLREHPVEADVDAAFGIIEGIDQRALRDDAVREAFRHILVTPEGHPLRARVIEAIRVLGRRFVVRFVSHMAERRAELERLDGEGGIYRRSDDEILRYWNELFAEYAATLLDAPLLRTDLSALAAPASGKDAQAVRELLRQFDKASGTPQRAGIFDTAARMMLTREGELRVSFAGSSADRQTVARETERVHLLASTLGPVITTLTGTTAEERHRRMLALTRTLLEIAHEAVRLYQETKEETGQLDFEDLQLKMRDLLTLETVSEQLRKRYAYVMVDEYQDTNQLQYDILLPMLARLARGNLFVVGDPKQSIYSFRQANVEVFQRTRSDIRHAAGTESDIVLEESFRPLRDIAAFVNLVFSRLMRRDADDYAAAIVHEEQVGYEELARARNNPEPGRVEILLREIPASGAGVSEGEMAARRIRMLVSSGAVVFDKQEKAHPVRFRDIAILLRSRTSLPELEQELLRAEIPYLVHSGVGYFQTQDIYDFYSYLQFLLNPSDDVALAGILRSPFFAVSDAELFDAVAARGNRSFWDGLRAIASRADTPASITNAVKKLGEDLAIARRFPVPELIARIARRSRYAGKIAGTVRADQAWANFEKLQTMARSYDRQGFASLYDFAARLRGLIDEEEREGQGAVHTEGDAVQLMTVHGAKGLEFPVVILPYLSRATRKDQEFFIDDRLGIGFSLPDESGEKKPPPVSVFLQRKNRARIEAEEQRIFYVACTRARDMLILSVDAGRSARRDTSQGWLLSAIAPDGLGAKQGLRYECTTRVLRTQGGRFVSAVEDHELRLDVLRAGDLQVPVGTPPVGSSATAGPRVLIEPVASEAKGEIFSATKIRTYVECPSRYFLRYILGLPMGSGPYARSEDEELQDREIPAELRGRIFHAVVEALALRPPGPADLAGEIASAFNQEAPLGLEADEAFLREMSQMIESVRSSVAWAQMQAGKDTRVEFTISAPLGPSILTGTLDRVYRDASGIWTVVDYKTDAVEADGLSSKGEMYWPQIEFYALLVSKYWKAAQINAILLFAAHPDRPLKRAFREADLQRIEASISSVLEHIRKGEFAPATSPCEDCPFAPEGCSRFFVPA